MWRTLARVFSFIGPGVIIASVALGPGSVTTASSIGAEYGYSLIWVVVLSSAAMMMYTVMAARFGATQERSFLEVVSDSYGRWPAILIGGASGLMAGSFQFGNNLGVSTAMVAITEVPEFRLELFRTSGGTPWIVAGSMTQVWPFLFTGTALAFVLFARNLYAVVEKLMLVLVLVMISAFMANLLAARPDLGAAARGLVPSVPSGDQVIERMAAMVGTTFVLHACLYQAYLVQAKGWKLDDIGKSVRDSVAGITVLGVISILVMMTSAAALRPQGIRIENAADMAGQLSALFGPYARVIFSMGLWAAAFSSIPVNAIIGGGLLADGLGLGRSMNQGWPRFFAVVIMVVGMLIAAFFPPANLARTLVLAQAATLLAVPAVAVGLFLVLNNRKVMGVHANGITQNVPAVLGLALILVMSYATYGKFVDQVRKARSAASEPVVIAAPISPGPASGAKAN